MVTLSPPPSGGRTRGRVVAASRYSVGNSGPWSRHRACQLTRLDRNFAYHQLTRILMHNGGRLADITVADCIEAYRAQVGYAARQHGHWYRLLRQAGILSVDSPPTIWAACRRGQLSVAELVDGYGVADLGLGRRVGRNSPLQRSVIRLCQFAMAEWQGEALAVRTAVAH